MDMRPQPFRAPAPVPHEGQLGLLRFLLTVSRNPLRIWGERAYREPFVTADWLNVPTIVVNDPATIRHCLVENARNYAMQPLRQRLLRPLLRDGLLTAEGELWRRTRRAISPIFTPKTVQSLAPVMAARAEAFADGLAAAPGRAVDVSLQMTLLTYDILQATLFSDDIAGEPKAFAEAMETTIGRMGRVDPLDVLDAPAFLPRPTRFFASRSETYFRKLIAETIERRQGLMTRDPASTPRDLLTLLLETEGLSRSEIEDNIITFIGAGHETTARALGWTLYLLSQAPEERFKVEEELDALLPDLPDPATWPDRLVHTRAAFEEAMRLYPPAASLNRTALEDDRFGDLEIPAGSSVLVWPWLVHRHRALWKDPDHFVPARFLPENRESIGRFQYIPFGVGPRVCIGQSFALQEGVILLASLLRRLRFDFAGAKEPAPVLKITIQPDRPLAMTVVRRR
ncbi:MULTISPECIES: cytochrome P450 [unclassified Aureimonas]|uniref:cytochrome P450 n=1 Tax=unclassified Aureimonas TaxID=2615206 RepID=UPI0006F47FFC|nr:MULTISPECIES: cytochrome P450 [unclassified Aureimonas]KQT64272.1 cytochrome P450 [Aureimonas sp. Leaf427]KQT81461.1 cytochrome P450 [Aureimonas sp. Leaf460]